MFQSRLNSIKDFILEHNTYFNTGYADVWIDSNTGVVSNNTKTVFPSDNLGNYFYLRLPNKVGFIYNKDFKVSDCTDGIATKTDVVLVAVIKNNNPDALLDNLIATIRNYRETKLQIKSAIYQPAYVITEELKETSKETQSAALKRLNLSNAYVSITFEMAEIVISNKLNCIEPPCEC